MEDAGGSKGGIEAEHRGTVRHVFLPSLYSRTGGKEKSGDLSLSRAKVDGGGGALPSSLADAFLKGLISWGTFGTPPLLLRPIGRSSVMVAQVSAVDLLLPFGEKDGWI